MASTSIFKRGQVVIVDVVFSNHSGVKPRPALVLSEDNFHRNLPDLIVGPISSQPRYHRKPGPGDCPLKEWRKIGLRHPSTVRISKLLSVDKKIIRRILASVSAEDWAHVETKLRQALALVCT